MTNRQPITAAALALAVTWASAACACALPSVEASGNSGHHDHHGMHESSPQVACAHADCLGDCGFNATSPKGTGVELPKTSLDGQFAVTVEVPSPFAVPSYHHPPWSTARPADSPVRRFDKLLN